MPARRGRPGTGEEREGVLPETVYLHASRLVAGWWCRCGPGRANRPPGCGEHRRNGVGVGGSRAVPQAFRTAAHVTSAPARASSLSRRAGERCGSRPCGNACASFPAALQDMVSAPPSAPPPSWRLSGSPPRPDRQNGLLHDQARTVPGSQSGDLPGARNIRRARSSCRSRATHR